MRVQKKQQREERNSVIFCPRDTCDLSGILPYELENPPAELSPRVNPENYPIMHRFVGVQEPTSKLPIGASDMHYSPPSDPPPFPISRRNLRPQEKQVVYLSLHNFGKQGEQAWMPFDGRGNNPSSS